MATKLNGTNEHIHLARVRLKLAKAKLALHTRKIHTSHNSVFSASARKKPFETIYFLPPIIGKNGAKLISYTWAFEWIEDWDNFVGETISKRVSDWTQAEENTDTGRNIVHKFLIEKIDGTTKTVSSESVLKILGHEDKTGLKDKEKWFRSLQNGLKTLAKLKMRFSILDEVKQKYDLAKQELLDNMPKIVYSKWSKEYEKLLPFKRFWDKDDEYNYVSIGDTMRVIPKKDSDSETQNHISNLEFSWLQDEMVKQGFSRYGSEISSWYDVKKRLERQEIKIKKLQSIT